MTLTGAYIMLAGGILSLAVGCIFIWLFIVFRKKKKANKEVFNVTPERFKFMEFWQYYTFIFVSFCGFIAAAVLFGVSVSYLVQNGK